MPASISIAASAVFTYHLVKLLVKPFIDVKLAANSYRVQLRRIVAFIDEHEERLTVDEWAGFKGDQDDSEAGGESGWE